MVSGPSAAAVTEPPERVAAEDPVTPVSGPALPLHASDVPNAIPEAVLQAAAVPAPLLDVPVQEPAAETRPSDPVSRSRRSRVPRTGQSTAKAKPTQRRGSLPFDHSRQNGSGDPGSAAAQLTAAAAAETAQLRTAAAAHLDSVIAQEVANAHRTYMEYGHGTPSLTDLLRQRVVERLQRFRYGPGRIDARKFVIAGTLVAVAAGAVVQHRTRGEDQPSVGRGQGPPTPSGYDTLHAVVCAPGRYARTMTTRATRDGDLQFARGVDAADAALLDAWFLAVTDPEARIAILDATLDHALATHNLSAVIATIRDRLPMIPGQEADTRADHIRLKAWQTLAAQANAVGDHALADRWRTRVSQLSRAILQQGRAVHGQPWSQDVRNALRLGITTVASQAPSHGHHSAYLRGYWAALQQARHIYALASGISWHLPPVSSTKTVQPTTTPTSGPHPNTHVLPRSLGFRH